MKPNAKDVTGQILDIAGSTQFDTQQVEFDADCNGEGRRKVDRRTQPSTECVAPCSGGKYGFRIGVVRDARVRTIHEFRMVGFRPFIRYDV